MKKNVFLITILCFIWCAFSCVDEDESIDVTLKNDTDSSVTFTYFSETIDENLPLSLESSKTRTVKYNHCAESLDFKVSYNDKLYSGTTNYVQDKSEYTINVFVENEVLKCKAAGNNSVTMTEISE
ncbi:hypothetical protein [Treponema sp.]|uniref:hypothetical protein n=1 Tax=Treponema sp. TaxID=166 RepID=UPI00388FE3E0